jgi:hypothetical protein
VDANNPKPDLVLKEDDLLKETIKFRTEMLKLLVGLFIACVAGTVAVAKDAKVDEYGVMENFDLIVMGFISSFVFLLFSLALGEQVHRMIKLKKSAIQKLAA